MHMHPTHIPVPDDTCRQNDEKETMDADQGNRLSEQSGAGKE
jgi:hypothetical protein